MDYPISCRQNNWSSKSLKNYSTIESIRRHLARGNSSYLCRHPELRAIIRVFLHELIDKQPENIYEFSAALFNCNNSPLLVTKINKQLDLANKKLKRSQWSEYDIENKFSEMTSTHSLLSRTSISPDIDAILRYAMVLRDVN
ncbi:uncharacterized protein LOC133324299 [Musca vetustissima]|uniref:uncharacterized protein LOC133324299 n=1 Tax=Musca vetustissima TaxID=27455 RepID=UPI002AB75008|nr:uncharacterized protein LOC133324299 [Musca vetustissima]